MRTFLMFLGMSISTSACMTVDETTTTEASLTSSDAAPYPDELSGTYDGTATVATDSGPFCNAGSCVINRKVTCHGYAYSVIAVWDLSAGDSKAEFETLEIAQKDDDGTWVQGLDYRLSEKTAVDGNLFWTSSANTTSKAGVEGWIGGDCGGTSLACISIPDHKFSKANKPYVRYEFGKDGDGKSNCVSYLFPFGK